jgi:hypothetical protein
MTGIITLTVAGVMTGPFNIYSNIDGFLSAFDTNITKAQLLAGYPTDNIPDGTITIRISSVGACYNYIDLIVPVATTTTSTSSTTTSTSSTTTSTSTSTTTTSSSSTTTTTTACPNRNLLQVDVSAHAPEVVTLSYVNSTTGTPVEQQWIADGSGEEVFHSFGVGVCVVESSVGIDVGTIILLSWNDGVDCCP